MKRKMLYGTANQGWAATSPLCYTLQRYAKYCHFGYTKTSRIFNHQQWHQHIPNKRIRLLQDIYNQVASDTWEEGKTSSPPAHWMNLKEDLAPLKDFPLKHLYNVTHGVVTIKNYIDYWTALHDHIIPQGYKSVADSYYLPQMKILLIHQL